VCLAGFMEQASSRRDAFHRRRLQSANRENDKMNDPIAQRSQRLKMSLFSGTQRARQHLDGRQTLPRVAMIFIAASAQSANRENDEMNDPIAQRSQRPGVSLFSGMIPAGKSLGMC